MLNLCVLYNLYCILCSILLYYLICVWLCCLLNNY